MHRALCLSGLTPTALMFAPLASQLDGRAELILKDLEGYAPDFPDDYGPEVELAAIKHGADAAGWDEFHLIGSSFGATVGLAFACRYPERVLSLALIEPVFLGNDTSWSDAYAALVTSLNAVLGAPLVDRPHAFRRALSSAPDAPPVDVAQAVPDWLMQRSERQGLMWPRSRDPAVGPDELVPHIAATCIAVGGRTHAGFHAIAERLCRQIPSAVVDLYPERSHFDPPHVAEAACFAEPVLEMWGKRSAVI